MNSINRILITGSRVGIDQKMVWDELDSLYETQVSPGRLVIVHGGAAGADTHANNWAWKQRRGGNFDVQIEVYPAQWRPEGVYIPSAGHQRNQKMVDLGADLVLCFIYNNSAGATGCMRMAMKAGLEVRVLRTNDQEEA
jgi:hypothetical protein